MSFMPQAIKQAMLGIHGESTDSIKGYKQIIEALEKLNREAGYNQIYMQNKKLEIKQDSVDADAPRIKPT
jgi:hypothetical protein